MENDGMTVSIGKIVAGTLLALALVGCDGGKTNATAHRESAALAQATVAPTVLYGMIVSTTPTSFVITTASGAKTIFFAPNMRFFGIAKSSLDKVTANSFIGTTVVPQPDGTYTSTEVHIFAPSLRGTGEGFTKMDKRGKRMMANATVKSVRRPSNMMANSTVRTVGSSVAGKIITMHFKSGTKRITIPANTRVTYIDPGSKTMLVRGAHVEVIAASVHGRLVTHALIVGERGYVPSR
jgi:hypothetical protein